MRCVILLVRAILAGIGLFRPVYAQVEDHHNALLASHAFKLRAIPEPNKYSFLKVQNWEVRIWLDTEDDKCSHYGILQAPLSSRINEGARMYFDPQRGVLSTVQKRAMFLGDESFGYPHQVDFGCEDKASVSENVQLVYDEKGTKAPSIDYHGGQFFACLIGWHIRLFWRRAGPLVDACVDVTLYLECIKKPMLKGATAPCCASAWNGTCFAKVEDSWIGEPIKPKVIDHNG